MPRAAQQTLLDGALAQGAALVRAEVLQSAQSATAPRQCNRTTIDDRRTHPALLGDVNILETVPSRGAHDALPDRWPHTHCGQRVVAEGSATVVIKTPLGLGGTNTAQQGHGYAT